MAVRGSSDRSKLAADAITTRAGTLVSDGSLAWHFWAHPRCPGPKKWWLPAASHAQSSTADFNFDEAFAGFMRDIGGSSSDGGGKVTFTGKDPIVHSRFRTGACMAIPAMGAGVGAAAIWRQRTGQ